jgi:ornithine cyclodeaminase/alanine dehydrogenase-like protein (mu-crystallin family)
MLVIDNDDVGRVLTPRDTIAVLEEAYQELATGEAVCRPRIDVRMPAGDGRRIYQWGSMEGGSARSGYFAIRIKSDILIEREYAGTRTQEKHCERPGLYCGLVWLFSVRDGAVRLAQLRAGTALGRTSDDEITFSERGNIQGAQFFAVAGRIYELAREKGLGRELPDDRLLQTVRD